MQWLHYGATIFPLIRLDPSLVRLFELFFPFRARPFGRRSPVTTIEKVRATLWSVRCVLAVTPNDASRAEAMNASRYRDHLLPRFGRARGCAAPRRDVRHGTAPNTGRSCRRTG